MKAATAAARQSLAEAVLRTGRTPDAAVDPLFVERHSPRAFTEEPVTREALRSLFEAARWAPSSYNEQPWRFAYAVEPDDLERFREPILPGNRTWADDAPALVYVLTKRHLDRTGAPNRHADFDAGAAWMSFALQAQRLGLATTPMGGFDRERAAEVLGVDLERFDVLAVVAVGHAPADRARGEASGRLPLEEIAVEGPLAADPASRPR